MWNKVEHHFGYHKSGESVWTKFIYNGKKNIKSVTTTCGCTTAKHDKKALKVILTIKVPEYLDQQYVERDILVVFDDGEENILKLKANYLR